MTDAIPHTEFSAHAHYAEHHSAKVLCRDSQFPSQAREGRFQRSKLYSFRADSGQKKNLSGVELALHFRHQTEEVIKGI